MGRKHCFQSMLSVGCPSKAGSTKTSPSTGGLGGKPRESLAGSPAPFAPADGRVQFFRSNYEWRWLRGSLLRRGLLSKHRETSQALCCSSDVLLLRCTSEMKLNVGEHISFWLSFLGNYVLLLKPWCLNLCLGFPSGHAPIRCLTCFYETEYPPVNISRKATSFRARLASSLSLVGAESPVPRTRVNSELQGATHTGDVCPSLTWACSPRSLSRQAQF